MSVKNRTKIFLFLIFNSYYYSLADSNREITFEIAMKSNLMLNFPQKRVLENRDRRPIVTTLDVWLPIVQLRDYHLK